jgi:hypothetical protein
LKLHPFIQFVRSGHLGREVKPHSRRTINHLLSARSNTSFPPHLQARDRHRGTARFRSESSAPRRF